MTVLFSSNLEGLTLGTYPSGWVLAAGAGMQVQSAGATGYPVVSGVNGFGRNGSGDAAVYTGSGPQTDQAVRMAFKVPLLTTAGFKCVVPLLRSNSTTSIAYRVEVVTDNTALRIQVSRYFSGGILLANSTYFLAPSPTDVVHLEAKVTGTLIEAWLWTGSTKPSTPTLSYNDNGGSGILSGYPGLIKVNSGWAMADDLVVTDGAGGEDFFYPPAGATINLVGSNCTQDSTSGTGVATITPPVPGTVNLVGSTCLQPASSGTGAVTVTPAIGTLTTRIFANNTNMPRALLTNCAINIYNATTGALVLRLTGLTTTADGRLVVTNAALVGGVTYAYEADFSASGFGRRLPVAVAA